MKKELKKGFTLIELMVVIAIIGILATTLAPKLREQLAKAKDAKAVTLLGATRTVASSLIITQMTSADDTGSSTVEISWDKLKKQMDITTKGLIFPGSPNITNQNGVVKNSKEAGIIIGGSRKKPFGKLEYGGTVEIVSATQGTTNAIGNMIFLGPSNKINKINPVYISNISDLHLLNFTSSLSTSSYSTEGKQWSAY